MIKPLLKILCAVLVAITLSGCFDNALRKIQQSTELSNRVLIDSGKKIVAKIQLSGDSIIKKRADSLYNAVLDMNGLIDSYKEQITNLSLVDKDVNLAYSVIAEPAVLKGALLSASSQLNKIVSSTLSTHNPNKADSLLADIRKINSDTSYFERNFKGIPPFNALTILSNLQLQSSVAGNFALNTLLKQSNNDL